MKKNLGGNTMASYCDKASEAVDECAHVAAVLYGILEIESQQGTSCQHECTPNYLQWLVNYGKSLRKEKDRQAVNDFLATRFGGSLHSLGLDVDITAKINE